MINLQEKLEKIVTKHLQPAMDKGIAKGYTVSVELLSVKIRLDSFHVS